LKILFYIETLRAGGKERRILELIRYLKDNTDFEIILVLMADDIHYTYVNDFNIKIYKLRKKYYRDPIFLSLKILRICKFEKPDIINVWGIFPGLNTLLTKLLLDIPIVNNCITNAYPNLKFYQPIYFLNKLFFFFSTIIVANSYAGLNSYNVSKNCHVIHGGFNFRKSVLKDPIKIKQEYNITKELNIVMVGRFEAHKDHIKLLDIYRILKNINSEIGLILVGDGINKNNIKTKIENDNLKNIILTGNINNVLDVVNVCDIGVLLSPYGEGISNAIMEYMFLKIPVVANNLGGNSELVDHNKTGYLIGNETNEEIALLLNGLLNNLEKRKIMGDLGHQRILEHFSIEKMGQEFIKTFEEVLKT